MAFESNASWRSLWIVIGTFALLLVTASIVPWVSVVLQGGEDNANNLSSFRDRYQRKRPLEQSAARVTFLGTSSLLFQGTRGDDCIMTDGFFTRSAGGHIGMAQAMVRLALNPFARFGSNSTAIEATLSRLQYPKISLIPVLHSHHDHSMDSGVVCQRIMQHHVNSSCTVLGSMSTAQVARGSGLSTKFISIAQVGWPEEHGGAPASRVPMAPRTKTQTFGEFDLTMYRSRHVPLPLIGRMILNKNIEKPVNPPAHLLDYLEGGTLSLHLVHRETTRSALIHGSAGYAEGALEGVQAHTVFLSVALISRQSEDYQEAFFREVVLAVGARRVVPIHWDDFTVPLDDSGWDAGMLSDRVGLSTAADFAWLERLTQKHRVELEFVNVWGDTML